MGALADRVRPRRLIATGYLLDMAIAALLALLQLPAVWCIVMVGAAAVVAPVFNGAGGRLTAEILTGDAYVLGRALNNMSTAVAQLAGLAVGGAAVAAIGSRAALLIAAGCCACGALMVRLGLPAGSPPPPTPAGTTVRTSWRGSRLLLTDRRVRRILLAQWLPMALAAGVEALLVPFAGERRL